MTALSLATNTSLAGSPATAGLTVAATVTASLGNGQYTVQVGKTQLTVNSPLDLVPEQEVRLQIQGNGATATVLPLDNENGVMAVQPGGDSVNTELSLTLPIKDFARMAAKQPEMVARAEVSFQNSEVMLKFSDGEQIRADFAGVTELAPGDSVGGKNPAETTPDPALSQETPQSAEDVPSSMTGKLFDYLQKFFRSKDRQVAAGNFGLQKIGAQVYLEHLGKNYAAEVILGVKDFAEWAGQFPDSLFTDAQRSLGQAELREIAPDALTVNSAGREMKISLPTSSPLRDILNPVNPPEINLHLGETLKVQGRLAVAAPVAGTAGNAANIPAIDKFILLAGLTPTEATRTAATALLNEGLTVDRTGIQTLLALTAGREGETRTEMLAAGARLLRMEVPVAPALAAGNAQAHATVSGVSAKIQAALDSLQIAVEELAPAEMAAPENAATSAGGISAERSGNSPAPSATGNSLAEVAEVLKQARKTLEGMAVMVNLKDAPDRLRYFMRTFARETLANASAEIENAAGRILDANPVLRKLDAALSVVLAKLNHEPENIPDAAAQPLTDEKSKILGAAADGVLGKGIPPGGEHGEIKAVIVKDYPARLGIREFPDAWRDVPEHFRSSGDFPRVEQALRKLLSANTPAEISTGVQDAVRNLDMYELRDFAARLQNWEHEEIARQPVLNRLAEAAAEIRDLGRMSAALKAENLATQQNDPAYCSATVPFKMGGENGDGQLRMYYRKPSKNGSKNWAQRVVLDLDFSALGSVIGDMRFTDDHRLSLVIGVRDREALTVLQTDQEELKSGLTLTGFACVPEFRLITENPVPPPPPPTVAMAPSRGLIDIKA